MKLIWIVESVESKDNIIGYYDNEKAAKECAEYYDGWVHKYYWNYLQSSFVAPETDY